jgi:phosphoribosylformylglycinamidine cyclo-ligase
LEGATISALGALKGMFEMNYEESGVSISRADSLVKRLKKLFGDNIGPFAGEYRVGDLTLIASADGIGSKLELEVRYDHIDSAAQDLVAMNVNDLFCEGAKPLFFLDYVGCNRIDEKLLEKFFITLKRILDGLNCKLIGGETAEMPRLYPTGKMEIMGFVVGKISTPDGKKLGKARVKDGDILIALPSNGPHSNGYTLINHLIENDSLKVNEDILDSLLAPTTIYDFKFVEGIHACAHITGGGIVDNVERVIPSSTVADFEIGKIPKVFKEIQRSANLSDEEMAKTFNLGTGFVLVVDPTKVESVMKEVDKYNPRIAGEVKSVEKGGGVRLR